MDRLRLASSADLGSGADGGCDLPAADCALDLSGADRRADASGTAQSPASIPLAARLARLRAHTVAAIPSAIPASTSPGFAPADTELAARLGGERIAVGVVRRVTRLELPLQLGTVLIDPLAGFGIDQLHALGLTRVQSAGDLMFLDTETTGLAGGTGTVAFMIGIARLGWSHLELIQWVLSGFSGETSMLEALGAAAFCCQALVSYNGKAFDVPLLRSRFALYGRQDALLGLSHVDLLHVARRMPRRGCCDLRLSSVESQWLGCSRDNDLPGSAAPSAWRRWLTQRDAGALLGVMKHNQRDLLALVALSQHAANIAAGLFGSPAAGASAPAAGGAMSLRSSLLY